MYGWTLGKLVQGVTWYWSAVLLIQTCHGVPVIPAGSTVKDIIDTADPKAVRELQTLLQQYWKTEAGILRKKYQASQARVEKLDNLLRTRGAAENLIPTRRDDINPELSGSDTSSRRRQLESQLIQMLEKSTKPQQDDTAGRHFVMSPGSTNDSFREETIHLSSEHGEDVVAEVGDADRDQVRQLVVPGGQTLSLRLSTIHGEMSDSHTLFIRAESPITVSVSRGAGTVMGKRGGDDEHASSSSRPGDEDSYTLLPEESLGHAYLYNASGDEKVDFTVVGLSPDTSLIVLDQHADQRFSARLHRGERFTFHGNGGVNHVVASQPVAVTVHSSTHPESCDPGTQGSGCEHVQQPDTLTRQLKPINVHNRSCYKYFSCR